MPLNHSLNSVKNVVLIHGFLRTKFSMFFLSRYLERNGFSAHLFGYNYFKYSIDQVSSLLANFIADKGLINNLYLVGHSLGGVIIYNFITTSLSFSMDIKRVVLLGSPLKGSSYAKKVARTFPLLNNFSKCFKDLQELNFSSVPPPKNIDIGLIISDFGFNFLIPSPNDGTVAVEEAQIDYATDTVYLKYWHSFMPYGIKVAKQTIYFFNQGRFNKGI